jgi:hypothetical protein
MICDIIDGGASPRVIADFWLLVSHWSLAHESATAFHQLAQWSIHELDTIAHARRESTCSTRVLSSGIECINYR